MFKRYMKQLFASLFARQTNETRLKEKKIDKQVDKLKQMQSPGKLKSRPGKKEKAL